MKPPKPPAAELERRRPVWEALSRLFLDTELQPDDHRGIARVLAASGYADEELDAILRREVGPVFGLVVATPVGEWAGFDPDWLQSEILKRQASWRRFLPASAGYRMVRDDWEAVKRLMAEEERENPG